jgi:hypothetical protein
MVKKKPPGRPKLNFKANCVYLSAEMTEQLRALGRGNVSGGIRYLLLVHSASKMPR